MWRQFKRQLRQWGGEVAGKWLRLTTFYRIVATMVVAMALAFVFRALLLDPLQKDLAGVDKKLSSKSVPARVAAPEEDSEIIELGMAVESLEKTLARALEDEKRAIAVLQPMRLSQASEAAAAMGRMVSRAGLRVVRFHEVDGAGAAFAEERTRGKSGAEAQVPPSPTTPPGLTPLRQQYELLGTFGAVYRFLHAVGDLPWPFQLSGLTIQAAPSTSGNPLFVNGQVLVRLSFVQTFYCYDYDRHK